MVDRMASGLSGMVALVLCVAWASTAFGQQISEETAIRLSFGRVMPEQPIEQVITFSNPTADILNVENIQLTPPLRAQDITLTILPHAEGSFRLVLGEERNQGPFEGIVQINFKEGKHPPIQFEIEGFVIPPIEFKPRAAFFVATHSGERKTASIEIINHREQPLLLTAVKSNSDRFSTELETINEAQHYRLNLTLDGNAEPGKKQEEIVLLTEPPMETPLKVQANTFIRERVYTFPESVDLGALPFKVATDSEAVQKLSQTLMVYRPGTTDFKVDASVDLDYLALTSERSLNGDRYQLTLTLLPEKVVPGKIEGTILITTNDEKFGELEVPVSGYVLD